MKSNLLSLPLPISLEQEKMRQDMAVLQRVLEQKERKMNELMQNTGQVAWGVFEWCGGGVDEEELR